MIKLTPREEEVIKNLLKNRPQRHKGSKTLRRLANQGFGELSANDSIVYRSRDFVNLETLIRKQSIADLDEPVQASPINASSNRLEVATYRSDEKWRQAKVFAQQILVVGMGCAIPLKANNVANHAKGDNKLADLPTTPRGVLPTVLPEYLDVSRFKRVVIIENGQLMTHWWLWRDKLPAKWQNAILLYRGHGDNLAWLIQMLPKLSKDCDVLLSFDMDLSGLQMVSHYANLCACSVHTLIPNFIIDDSSTALSLTPSTIPLYNQPSRITLQLDKVSANALHPVLRPIYQQLVDHNIALMQEHLWQDEKVEWVEVRLN